MSATVDTPKPMPSTRGVEVPKKGKKKPPTATERVLSVWCPHCGAKPGERCIEDYDLGGYFHYSRVVYEELFRESGRLHVEANRGD